MHARLPLCTLGVWLGQGRLRAEQGSPALFGKTNTEQLRNRINFKSKLITKLITNFARNSLAAQNLPTPSASASAPALSCLPARLASKRLSPTTRDRHTPPTRATDTLEPRCRGHKAFASRQECDEVMWCLRAKVNIPVDAPAQKVFAGRPLPAHRCPETRSARTEATCFA